jgi:transcriptional regulator with XRE-family HTH domain
MLAEWKGGAKMPQSKFGLRLKELREKAGLTQQQLADKAVMSLGGLTKLEQGINRPSWDAVLALAGVLGVDCRAFQEEPASTPEPKRGRPPKSDTDIGEKVAGLPIVKPKKRGRPRKTAD